MMNNWFSKDTKLLRKKQSLKEIRANISSKKMERRSQSWHPWMANLTMLASISLLRKKSSNK